MARSLYHQPLSPYCRTVRLVLAEKRLAFDLIEERPWEERDEFLNLNPGGTVPVLVDDNGAVLAESSAIVEYLDEVYTAISVIPGTPAERGEVRRVALWYDLKFGREVSGPILFEKADKRLNRWGEPDLALIRASVESMKYHLEYVSFLADARRWLGGDLFSLADITVASHLSALDYLGDVPWAQFPDVKDWYARVKSRPAFRPLLDDALAGLAPPRIYADLDF